VHLIVHKLLVFLVVSVATAMPDPHGIRDRIARGADVTVAHRKMGPVIRAYGYIYTKFGLETSHSSLSEQAPSIKLTRARWAGSGSRLANEDHCLILLDENDFLLFCIFAPILR
jgi:hypothetical protein